MRKIVIFGLMVAFLLAVSTAKATAQDLASKGNCADQQCRYWEQNDPEGFYGNWANIDECVSFFRSGVVSFCKFLVDLEWVDSVGDCVSYLRPNIADCRDS